MNKSKKTLKFIIHTHRAGGFRYVIESSNGKNLSPQQPYNRKQSAEATVASIIHHIQSGNVEIIDAVVKKKVAKK